MRLIYSDTQKPVNVNDVVKINGRNARVLHTPRPHKPESSGKVTVRYRDGWEQEYYVSVIGAEWIEREDRQPEPPTKCTFRHERDDVGGGYGRADY